MTPPLCKDCAHFTTERTCRKAVHTDLVLGGQWLYSCTDVRSDTARCGPSGKWFEAAEPSIEGAMRDS